jgi:bacterial leucyl aminopeptidase
VLEVDANELDNISHLMHEQFGRCGGFLAHDSLADARAALTPAPSAAAIDYTIDHAPVVEKVLPVLDRNAIKAMIGELSAMPTRYYRSATGAAASTWLRDRWRSFTTRSDVTVELFDQGYPQQSVIMTIPGSTRANEVVVIGGHLDSIRMYGGKDARAPGADDDASGIATLSEVARALLANHYRPARTIKFIAYAAEEIGLRGSQAIVKNFKDRGINVVGALQLDMTNYQGSEKDIWLMKDFTDARQNEFVIKLIDTYVGATWGLDACGYGCSDHASWYRAGVPASMPFESRMRDRNKSIHTADDTLELSNNNADHALKFARLGAAYAIEMAKGELGPPPAPKDGGSRWAWIAIFGGLALGAGALVKRK